MTIPQPGTGSSSGGVFAGPVRRPRVIWPSSALAVLVIVWAIMPLPASAKRADRTAKQTAKQAAIVFDRARFATPVPNPYHPLVPGTTCRYVERLGRHVSDIEITVMAESRAVMGVKCAVVRERVHEKDELTQETLTFFAPDDLGNVWMFGEEAEEFLGRGRVSTEGSWQAGEDGAQPGIAMPASPVLGEPYRMGFLADIAEDMVQIIALGDSVTAPAGAFGHCIRTHEWSMLESGTDKKWYAPGIGLVKALSAAGEEMMLVSRVAP